MNFNQIFLMLYNNLSDEELKEFSIIFFKGIVCCLKESIMKIEYAEKICINTDVLKNISIFSDENLNDTFWELLQLSDILELVNNKNSFYDTCDEIQIRLNKSIKLHES